jgi:AraC-like DNA-binding protein/CheY-like chemotaxis protein
MSVIVFAPKEIHEFYRSFHLKGEKVEVSTLKEACGFIKKCQGDIILLDCGFEFKKGLQLLKEIKVLCPRTPVIFLSEERAALEVEALHAGAREFIEKPFKVIELRNSIERLLKLKRSSEEKRSAYVPSSGNSDTEDLMNAVTSDKPAYLIRSIRYIEENFSEHLTLSNLAKEANVSKYHFCRLFLQHTGMSPMQFVNRMRIQKAKELLRRGDLTVSCVALQVGFNDLGGFIRQFKKFNTVTPAVYKKTLNH